jgi:hypothetical protein
MSLPPDLVEMLSVFADAGVRYLVIGGHAVSLHARPRTTKDLDLWLDAAPENIGRACSALLRFGVPDGIVADLRSARPDEIVWMGRVPARIDFLQTVPGLEFHSSWERRVTAEIAGVPVQFIGRNDLLVNKRAVGRPQDLRDVRALERAAEAEPRKRRSAKRKATKTTLGRKR